VSTAPIADEPLISRTLGAQRIQSGNPAARSTPAASPLTRVARLGTLPFTGSVLVLVAAAGAALLGGGLLTRRGAATT
jgi:hypothetical protein